jgi:poly(A) polymerase
MTSDHHATRQFAVDVVQRLRDSGYQALWAGGCVRDLVLEHEPHDYDVATTATPEEVRSVFGKRHTVPVGAAFGVILVIGPEGAGQIEVATFRREGEYVDGRRPESVEYCTPEEDAHRRDFTINGMFYDPLTETIHDYVGGEEDLKRRLLRCIGNPEDRFYEDKLRMLRAVRFAARFGFELESRTAEAVRKHAQEITVVSVERITQELRKMLAHDNRRRAIELALELELWPVILPEIPLPWPAGDEYLDLFELLQQFESPSPELVLSVLCGDLSRDAADRLARRLRLSNQQREKLLWLMENREGLRAPEQLPLHRFKQLLVHEHRDDLLEYTRAAQEVREGKLTNFEYCDHYLSVTPPEVLDPEPLLTGDDLIERGLQPGEEFKFLLDQVRIAQLDERIHTQKEAWKLVEQLREEGNAGMK